LFSFFILNLILDSTENKEDVLVQRCLDGDASAERILAERYLSRIKVYVSYKLKGRQREDIEDIVQDVLMEAFSSLHKLKEKSKFSAWIHQIARNHCFDYLTEQSQKQEEIAFENNHSEQESELASQNLLPLELILREELSQQVRKAVKELPLNYREVIVLREFLGLSYQKIAETLSIEVSTVKNRLHKARNQLREKLKRLFP